MGKDGGIGLNFDLAPEEVMIRQTVRDFAEGAAAPGAKDRDEKSEFSFDLMKQMGELGFFGLPFSEEWGGSGAGTVSYAIAVEEISRIDASLGLGFAAHVSLGCSPVYLFGTRAQKEEYLTRAIDGTYLAAFGLTEPDGGSDAGATRTTARLDGDEWVIDGTKAFITNSGTDITGLVTVTAVTGRAAGDRPQISAIIVPAGTQGFTVSKKYSKVGWLASDTRELSFADCRVPAANLLGEEGRGYAQFLEILDGGRVALAALSTGLAQGCVDECLAYMGERAAFGRKLGEFQALQFKLADMAARAHTARLAYRDAAARLVAGAPFTQQAAIAKLVASDAAMANARDATQIFGGAGFLNETPVGRFYRDAKILEIGEGTSEVQRMLIARELGLPARP